MEDVGAVSVDIDDKVYIPVAKIAKVLGWRTQRAKRWLIREGAGVKIGGLWYTTRDRLRASFPEVLTALDLS